MDANESRLDYIEDDEFAITTTSSMDDSDESSSLTDDGSSQSESEDYNEPEETDPPLESETAQPSEEEPLYEGSKISKILSLNRAAVGWAVSCSAFGFFFVGEQTQTPTANCLDWMMSSSANYRPFLSSFRHIPPSGGFCQVSELTVYTKKWRPNGENFYLVQVGPKSFGDGRQDICKDKASNLGPVAGY